MVCGHAHENLCGLATGSQMAMVYWLIVSTGVQGVV